MTKKTKKISWIVAILVIGLYFFGMKSLCGQSQGETIEKASGSIKGRILDYETKKPLANASVAIVGANWQTHSEANGQFVLPGIPVGSYTLECSLDGYYADTRTDVIVRPGRTTFLNVQLFKARMIKEEVSITADYFPDLPYATGSNMEFNAEELRRDAGGVGVDINRSLYNVPGVIKADEIANDLLVRGGSPMENGYYIDNIPFINVNHFPQQGASGGNVSMLNPDFIEKIRVSTGGFDASFGNRLSSIIDISYREGSRERFQGQLNLSLINYSAEIEGPFPGKRGSWMISASRSNLNLIESNVSGGEGESPSFYDFQGKINFDISDHHHLSLLVIRGHSQTLSVEDYEKFNQYTVGLNWRWIWGGKGYSDTSISFSKLKAWDGELGLNPYLNFDYHTGWVAFRNVNHLQIASSHQLKFGIEAQRLFFKYINPTENLEDDFNGIFGSAFLTYTFYPFRNFSLVSGLRLDYFPFSERLHLSPRLSFSWMLTDRLSLNGSFGMFYQQMSLFMLKQHPDNIKLQDPQARHLVLGLKYLLSKDMQLTLDLYDKQYRHMPMAVRYGYSFPFDNVSGDNATAFNYGLMVDKGESYARGVEFSIQKKMSDKFYGLVSFTYFRTRYRDLMGLWHNRIFDNRFIICVSGGFKPNKKWEFSGRWIWSGNRAFTPVDEAKSIQFGYPWIPVENILSDYLPDYQTLSLRMDKRFFFRKSNLVLFAGALNIFNRENEMARFWDSRVNQYIAEYMWGIVPYIGIEYEF